MSLPMKPKNHFPQILILAGSGIVGSWLLWRHFSKRLRTLFDDPMNDLMMKGAVAEYVSEENESIQETAPTEGIDTAQAVPCVLAHFSISFNTKERCTPNHWHATYWLCFVALIEQEPRRAIVQHTDTKRYHLMIQILGEQILSCNDCASPQEVFRLPVEDHYAYFVFAPQQDLDGFALFPHAHAAAHALSIPLDFHRLLLDEQTNRVHGKEA